MVFETERCAGCRSCEMACSYHHRGEFSPSISSIQILDRRDEFGFAIYLAEQDEGKRIACDGCKGLDEPLCVKYCTQSDELEDILKEFQRGRLRPQ